MHEIFPIVAGVAVGALGLRLVGSRWRLPVLVVLSLLFGLAASWASGELAVSWGFLSVDTALVLGAALLTVALLGAWQRRGAERRVRVE